MNARLLLLALVLACGIAGATETPATANFGGPALDGQQYELAARRGRVVMIVLWRSDCPVCMDKLAELRANAQGWKAAPFDLVLVNLDANPEDALAYERIRRVVSMRPAKSS